LAPISVSAANAPSQLAIQQVNTNYRTDNVKASNEFKVYLNGEDKTSTFSNPVNVTTEGRTLLPLRDLGNLLGCTIEWNAEHKVAIVTKGSTTIEVPIGSTNIIINGTSKKIDEQGTQAIIVSSRTYLPFRSIAEAAGATVDYKVENNYKNIYITTDGSSSGGTVTPTPTPSTNTDLKTAKELGFSTSNIPAEGQPYHDSLTRAINAFRQAGLTDDQINQNLQYIIPCAANDDGSGVATQAQSDHFTTVCMNTKKTLIPTEQGTYKYQMKNAYMWDGTSWFESAEDYAGMTGLVIGM
jgi:hypothetical protein